MPLPRAAAAAALLLPLLAGGCSRLTFVKPDLGDREYERIAPSYEFRDDEQTRERTRLRNHLALATAGLATGDLAQAEREARAALDVAPDTADAYTLLAIVADRRGEDAAGGLYARAAELAPMQGAALNNYGAWLCAHGRAAESLGWFERALADAAYRQRASALANAGSCTLSTGSTAGVEDHLRQALSLDPENATALAAMADLEYRRGRYLQARAFSERRLAAAPASASVLLLASQIEDKLGDRAAAARYVQRLRTDFPRAGTLQTGDTSQP